MTWRLTEEEFRALLAAPREKRYRYFLNHAADEQRVWALADERDQLALVATETSRLMPFWPHKRYTEHDLASGRWRGVAPIGIHVDDVLEQVVPDAAEDGVLFAIFPGKDGQFVVAPNELERDLRRELAKYS